MRPALRALVEDFEATNSWRMGRAHLRSVLRIIRQFLADEGIEGADLLTISAVERHAARLHERGRSIKTILNRLSALDRFGDFLYARGLLLSNPVRLVRRPRVKRRPFPILSPHELRQVLAMAWAIGCGAEVGLAIYTGLRASELRTLTWGQVDMASRRITVEGKSASFRCVPIHPEAMEILREQRAAAPDSRFVFPGGRRKGVAPFGAGVWADQPRGRDWWYRDALAPLQEVLPCLQRLPKGRTGRGWHIFRHTWVSMLAPHVAALDLARWAGHADPRTTMLYLHQSEGYDPRIEAIPAFGPDCPRRKKELS